MEIHLRKRSRSKWWKDSWGGQRWRWRWWGRRRWQWQWRWRWQWCGRPVEIDEPGCMAVQNTLLELSAVSSLAFKNTRHIIKMETIEITFDFVGIGQNANSNSCDKIIEGVNMEFAPTDNQESQFLRRHRRSQSQSCNTWKKVYHLCNFLGGQHSNIGCIICFFCRTARIGSFSPGCSSLDCPRHRQTCHTWH